MRTALWAAAGVLLLSACAPGTYVIRPLDEGWRSPPAVEREVVRETVREVVIEVPITHPVLPDPVDRPRPRPEPPVTPPAPPVEPPEVECRTREMPPKSPFSHQIKCPGSPVVLVRR